MCHDKQFIIVDAGRNPITQTCKGLKPQSTVKFKVKVEAKNSYSRNHAILTSFHHMGLLNRDSHIFILGTHIQLKNPVKNENCSTKNLIQGLSGKYTQIS